GELRPGERVGAAGAVRRAVERIVVEQKRHAVRRQLDVELDHSVTVSVAGAHRRERVLRRNLAGAAMRHAARIRPGPHAIRAPLSASKRATRAGTAAGAIGSPTVAGAPCGSRAMIEPPDAATWISVSAPSASIISTLPTRLAALGAHGVRCSGRTPVLIWRPSLTFAPLAMAPPRPSTMRPPPSALP